MRNTDLFFGDCSFFNYRSQKGNLGELLYNAKSIKDLNNLSGEICSANKILRWKIENVLSSDKVYLTPEGFCEIVDFMDHIKNLIRYHAGNFYEYVEDESDTGLNQLYELWKNLDSVRKYLNIYLGDVENIFPRRERISSVDYGIIGSAMHLVLTENFRVGVLTCDSDLFDALVDATIVSHRSESNRVKDRISIYKPLSSLGFYLEKLSIRTHLNEVYKRDLKEGKIPLYYFPVAN
jgi:hypothetical protein